MKAIKFNSKDYFAIIKEPLFAKVDLHDYKGNAQVIGMENLMSLVLLGRNKYEMIISNNEIVNFFDKNMKELDRVTTMKKYMQR